MFFQGQYCLLTAFYFTPSSHHQAFLKFNLPHQNLQHPPKVFKMSLKQFLGRLQKMVLFTIKLSTRITQPPQKLQVVCLTSVLVPFFSKYHQGYPTFKLEAIHTSCIGFQTAKKLAASNLGFQAFKGFISTKNKTKQILFSRGLFQKIPFLYFSQH